MSYIQSTSGLWVPGTNTRPTQSAAPAPAPVKKQAVAAEDGFIQVAAPKAGGVAQLEKSAREQESKVLTLARAAAYEKEPSKSDASVSELSNAYQAWRSTILELLDRGALSSPAVKSFTAKTEQAALLDDNLPPDVQDLKGPAYRVAVEPFIERVCVAASDQSLGNVVADNPLLLVPSLSPQLSIDGPKAKGVPTVRATVNGKAGEVRTDVVMVFCPGVARTGKEFKDQMQTALDAGVASARAETGNFLDADVNADAIATAVTQAKALVGNVNAKVILVGYSQGNTNLFAFMRDKDNKYPVQRKDVVAIHTMHSAAGGSHLADMAWAMGRWLTTDAQPSEREQHLIEAFAKANASFFHLPESAADLVTKALVFADKALSAARSLISRFKRLAQPVLESLGIKNFSDEAVGKRLLELAVSGDDWVEKLSQRGRGGELAAKVLRPVWEKVKDFAKFLQNETVGPFIEKYIKGGLYSLTSEYCDSLMTDPRLKANLKDVLVLNSTGAVPVDRRKDLVPPSQRLGFQFFETLGLDSDYQVALEHQRLGQYLPNAVDLPPEAIGHWGVAGVIVPVDHGVEFFKDFSPTGLTRSALTTYSQLGIL